MKKNYKLTLSAMMVALATAFMLLSYFPYLTYAIPAISGLFIMVTVIEINKKWAVAAYFASVVLVFLFAETESRLLYIVFFGYYPILKAVIEKINNPLLEWIYKFVIFNTAVLLVYFVFSSVFNISLEGIDILGKYGAVILLLLGNIVFVFYDIAVSRMAMVYMNILHPKIKKLLQ